MDGGQPRNRRQILKIFTIGGVATALVLPTSWTKPLVKSVIVPAHAQASPHNMGGGPSTTPGPSTTGSGTTAAPFCSNGQLDSGESCDDGNLDVGDGCDATCDVEPGFACAGEPSACVTLAP
ncbi:MAG: myxococcus cysteine-rich repeat containing protein [Methyloceanibacter sp.]